MYESFYEIIMADTRKELAKMKAVKAQREERLAIKNLKAAQKRAAKRKKAQRKQGRR